jgi:hypothetical protein
MATILDALYVTLGMKTEEFKKGEEEAERVYEELVKAAKAAAKATIAAAKGKSAEEIDAAKEAAKETQAAAFKAARKIRDTMVKEAKEAAEKTKEQTEKIQESFKSAGEAVLEFFGIMAAATGMVEFVKSSNEAALSAKRLADEAHTSMEAVEAYRGVIKDAGGTAEEADAAIKGVGEAISVVGTKIRGAKMSENALKTLGIDAKTIKKESPAEQLATVAEGLHKLHEQGKDMQALKIGSSFGMSPAVVRSMSEGGEATKKAIEEQLKLGVAHEQDAKNAEALERSMNHMKASFATVGLELMGVLMPALLGMGKALTAISAWMAEHSDAVKAGILGIAAAFVAVNAQAIRLAIQSANTWATMLGPLDLIPIAIGVVVAGIALLIAHWKEVGHWFHEIGLDIVYWTALAFFDVTKAGAKMWKSLKESAMAPLNWIWEKLKAIVDIYKQEGNFIAAVLHGNVKGAVGAVKAAVGDVGAVTGLTHAYAGVPASAGMALRPSSISNSHATSTSTRQTTINGPINIQTQATDPQGIASGIGGAIKSHSLVDQADGGY